jgi:indolepyruvate ferredoxin oxidoreductase alpha subunit
LDSGEFLCFALFISKACICSVFPERRSLIVNAVVEKIHPVANRRFMSGNEAVARGVWEAGVRVATAYPGTPATEILEYLGTYSGIHANWSPNEKVSLEVAIGASMCGSRAFCAMKHVGMNVAADALMTQTLAGVEGGLVIAIADDVGMSSSQNEQDSRYWGRFAHLPMLEPADSQEAYAMVIQAFDLSEQFDCPVILRLTTRICHVKGVVSVGERQTHSAEGFTPNPARWVMVPGNAKKRLQLQQQRDLTLRAYSEQSDLNFMNPGKATEYGFVTSGPAYTHVKEAFPESPVYKIGFSHPLPVEQIRAFAQGVETLVVVEETEPLIELELRAAGLTLVGKEYLPATGELAPEVLLRAIRALQGEEEVSAPALPPMPSLEGLFPRPPTMCVSCPHLAVFYTLSRLRKRANFAGDIGCYTLGAGQPWNALDTCICMGSAIGIGLGMDLGRGERDQDKGIFSIIGDSTFLHLGIQGLLDLVYNQGNVTVMILDNSATGMTGGQNNHGNGKDLRGKAAPQVDFAELACALGVARDRVHVVDPYDLPVLYRTVKQEMAALVPSVIVAKRPCVLTERYTPRRPLMVEADKCNGCANCLSVGCPAILVTRRETEVRKGGREVMKAWVRIESAACTGCDICLQTCGPDAMAPADLSNITPIGESPETNG